MSDSAPITLREFGYGLIYGAAARNLRFGIATQLELDTPRAHRAMLEAYEHIQALAQFRLDHHPRLEVSYDWHEFLNRLEQAAIIEPASMREGIYLLRVTQPMFIAAQRNFFGERWALWEQLGWQFGEACR